MMQQTSLNAVYISLFISTCCFKFCNFWWF